MAHLGGHSVLSGRNIFGAVSRRTTTRGAGLVCLALVLAVAGVCGGWAAWLRMSGNLHEVDAGVYRSAQPDPMQVSAFVRERHVKTVLNLRGDHAGDGWYDAEASAVIAGGARLVSIRLSADHEPDGATLTTLVETLRTADRPMLIHCNGGADRAGLAAAVYELAVAHRPAAVAAQQLSFRYGHFPWLTSRTGAMDRAFWRVANGAPVPATGDRRPTPRGAWLGAMLDYDDD